MSFDMTQFYQVFFEETAEHLSGMESMLLELDVHQPDAEQLNAIFRAAHSIKGSSGTFGFNDLAEVTHILENLLDRIRKGELALRENMIDAFLDAGDILKSLLAAHRGEAVADPSAVAAICARLRDLTNDEAPTAPASVSSPASSAPAVVSVAPATAPASTAGYEISFVVDESAPDGIVAIDNLLGELGSFGQAQIIARPISAEQPWRLSLVGAGAGSENAGKAIDEDSLREMLEFIARSDSIRIAPIAPHGAAVAASATADGAYGFSQR